MLLAGDIGGTNTRLALFEEGKELKKVAEARFQSQNYPALLPIVQEFLFQQKKTIRCACFGVAGPVKEGMVSRTPNLHWFIDTRELKSALKLESVFLLNDLEAQAWGIRMLKPEDFCVLQKGDPNQKGNAAIIAAGTGLGEAGLYWNGTEHLPFAGEGGHVDFAPRTAIEMEFLAYMKKERPRISYERVLSGKGLHNLYQFLIDSGREQASSEVTREMKTTDPGTVITNWGKHGKDPACSHTIDWFLSLYGAEAGNLALKFLTLGGLYIGGGIAPRILDKFKEGGFLKAFLDKGRFQEILETIPVKIILNDHTGLYGAAHFAQRKKPS